MNRLAELIRGDIKDPDTRLQTAKDLLIYCRQDSWAMVAIYKKLLESFKVQGDLAVFKSKSLAPFWGITS